MSKVLVKAEAVEQALDDIIKEGRDDLIRNDDVLNANVKALSNALQRAMTDADIEVRLTYKTLAQSTCAWSWMVAAAVQKEVFQAEKSRAFDVELDNGSAIIFGTDEAVVPASVPAD